MSDERLIREPHIWDLHIHTPLGTRTKKNYGGCSTEEFITNLIKIYDSAPNRISMISFTDHNQINVEAYTLFRENSSTHIIPGIELDVFLTNDARDSKHVIFYFSEKEFDDLTALNDLIINFIKESNYRVMFDAFVTHLLFHKKQFAISPHAFKQGKRGINEEWVTPETTYSGVSGFSGLFFPFWEAAGKSDICKAQEFLISEDCPASSDQSVIAFSDSADYEKIKAYIANPPQYFLCLDSYKGLLMAGSDPSRIIYKKESRPNGKPAEKIKQLSLQLQPGNDKSEQATIELSDRLNVIIGGRGKGKSALLDALVYSLSPRLVERKRARFVEGFNVSASNFNDTRFVQDLRVLYYHQSFISKLFDGDRTDRIQGFFSEHFSKAEGLSEDISDVQQLMVMLISSCKRIPVSEINIVDDLHNLVVLSQQTKYFAIQNTPITPLKPYTTKREGFAAAIRNLLPKDSELWSDEVTSAFNEFICLFLINLYKHNYKGLFIQKYPSLIKGKIEDIQSKKSATAAKHSESKKHLTEKLRSIYAKELERIYQINRLYQIPKEFTELQTDYATQEGEDGNLFYFVTAITKEHPVEFAVRQLYEAADKRKMSKDSHSFTEMLRDYAIEPSFRDKLRDQFSIQTIQDHINNLDGIVHKKVLRIIYKTPEHMMDLYQASPGTQTNAIMECIFHSDSTIPLFIDQPEDNIDNEARYQKLTKWIRHQKVKRQIIVVTHDANIVINGDAECVIIADHDSNSFQYQYGALEYDNILDRSSSILDGGRDAIKRRISKYGE